MVKCIKCKAQGEDIVLKEFWHDHGIEFQQNADGSIEKEGILFEGCPYKVVAKCFACGYFWTLRGVIQITGIDAKISGKALED